MKTVFYKKDTGKITAVTDKESSLSLRAKGRGIQCIQVEVVPPYASSIKDIDGVIEFEEEKKFSRIKIPVIKDDEITIIRSHESIGDPVCMLSGIQDLFEQGIKVYLQMHENSYPLFKHHPAIYKLQHLDEEAETETVVNLSNPCPCGEYERNNKNIELSRNKIFALAMGSSNPQRPKLYLTEEEIDSIEIEDNSVGLVVRSAEKYKDYPYMQELADELKKKDKTVYAFDKELELDGCINITGEDIRTVAVYLSKMEYVIGPDTGLMHICDALNTKYIALLGSMDAEVYKNRPFSTSVSFLQGECKHDKDPCIYDTCNELDEHQPCMEWFSVEYLLKHVAYIQNKRGFLLDMVTDNPKRGFGDYILSTALLSSLKQTFGFVDVFARREAVGILKDNPNIRQIFVRKPDKEKYEQSFVLARKLEDYNLAINRQHRIKVMADLLGITEYNEPELFITEDNNSYRENGINIGLSIGATCNARIWIEDYLLKFIDKLQYEIDYDFSFHIFSKEDIDIPKYAYKYVDKPFKELFQIVDDMDYMVATDSFISHIAGALGIPTLVMYSEIPKDWRVHNRMIGIQAPVSCSPCWARQKQEKSCSKKGIPDCVKSFTPDYVIFKLLELMGKDFVPTIRSSDGLGDIMELLPLGEELGLVDYQVNSTYMSIFEDLDFVRNVYSLEETLSKIPIIDFSGRLSDYKKNRIDAVFEFMDIPVPVNPSLSLVPQEHDLRDSIVIAPVSTFNSTTFTRHGLRQLIDNLPCSDIVLVHNEKIVGFEDVMNLSSQTSIEELIGIINQARYVITVDTSVMHIAGVLEKPFCVIVSTMPPDWQLKYYSTGTYVKSDLECCPCGEDYPKGTCKKINNLQGRLEPPYMPCMVEIDTEEIVRKVRNEI